MISANSEWWAPVHKILAKGDFPDQRRRKQVRIGIASVVRSALGYRRWLRSSRRRSAMVSNLSAGTSPRRASGIGAKAALGVFPTCRSPGIVSRRLTV